MAISPSKLSRRVRRSRRTHRSKLHGSFFRETAETPHERAIRRLALEIRAGEPLVGVFHAGVSWTAMGCLFDQSIPCFVEVERSLKFGRKRFVPDLTIRCARTEKVLLVVEVWHTHAVTLNKKQAFLSAGLPWVEVKSWHVISRHRHKPLPILDWGGRELPHPPLQFDLFQASSTEEPTWASFATCRSPVAAVPADRQLSTLQNMRPPWVATHPGSAFLQEQLG